MPSPSSPRLTEEEQRQFENFSEVIRSSPPLTAEDQHHFADFSHITGSLIQWPAWERLQRRIALSEEGAMTLGLMQALPGYTNEEIVGLVLQAVERELTEGEEGALLNLVKSVWDDGQSDDAGPDNMATEDEDEPLSTEEEEDEGDDDDNDDDDDDDDNDEGKGDKPKQKVRSSCSAC